MANNQLDDKNEHCRVRYLKGLTNNCLFVYGNYGIQQTYDVALVNQLFEARFDIDFKYVLPPAAHDPANDECGLPIICIFLAFLFCIVLKVVHSTIK